MMRPRLKSDVLYVPTGDGVHVFGAGTDLALRGRSAYQWLDRLAPHLDGSVELDDLVGRLPDDKRQAVHALVGQLHAAGCLFDAGEDLPHRLTRREWETYASQIAFIEYHGDSAAHRFETYRDSGMLVVGAGPVFVSLICSALRSGVRHLRAVCTEEAVTHTERLAELTAEAAVRDPEQRITHIAYDEDELGRDIVGRVGAVVHVADGSGVDRALWLDELCREAGTLLVQGLVVDDVAWLGPAGSDWRSAWLRLDARGPFRPNAFLTGPAAAVVASHLGLAAFTALTGIAGSTGAADGARKMTRIDLETLRTSTHAFLPHPAAAPPVRRRGRSSRGASSGWVPRQRWTRTRSPGARPVASTRMSVCCAPSTRGVHPGAAPCDRSGAPRGGRNAGARGGDGLCRRTPGRRAARARLVCGAPPR
ncbi:hypothetical protein O1L68_00455 [Streptomyces lydicus]|nr:hypothetical protein [Streptomyces lydicus]